MATAALRLTNRDVAARFNEAAAGYDASSNVYTTQRRAVELARHARGQSIEIGGGTGAVSAAIGDRSRHVHSDIAPRMCQIAARALNSPSVCFDAEAIPLADASMDTLLSAEMIYYLARPQRFLSEARRVLRPGGRLVISTTNPLMTFLDRGRALLRKLGFRRMFFDDGSPTFPCTAEVERLLREAGFVVEAPLPIVVLPFAACDGLNRILERTPLRHFSLFVVLSARAAAS